jgi:VanZ family protein
MRFIPAIIWVGLTYWGCLMPSSEIPTFDFWDKIYFDKILHIIIYSALIILLLWAAKGSYRHFLDIPKSYFIIAIAFCLLMGLSIEFLQDILPINRSFDIYDFMANIVGLSLGLCIWKYVIPRTIWSEN